MKFRKVKLALTVGLINSNHKGNSAFKTVREMMKMYKGEVGKYLGIRLEKKVPLNNNHIRNIVAFQFEKCTLKLDMILNKETKIAYINGFNLV